LWILPNDRFAVSHSQVIVPVRYTGCFGKLRPCGSGLSSFYLISFTYFLFFLAIKPPSHVLFFMLYFSLSLLHIMSLPVWIESDIGTPRISSERPQNLANILMLIKSSNLAKLLSSSLWLQPYLFKPPSDCCNNHQNIVQ
jgi:hypothetical protein